MHVRSYILSSLIVMGMVSAVLRGGDRAVYISPETPWLSEISALIDSSGDRMYSDSLSGAWTGELLMREAGDSLSCTLIIHLPDEGRTDTLGTFRKAYLSDSDRQSAYLRYALSSLGTVLLMLALFFIRF